MFTRDVLGHYEITGLNGPATETDVLQAAEEILLRRLQRLGSLNSPSAAKDFLRMRLGALEHEEFHAIWLDNRHNIIAVDRLATGTIDGAAVYPREVLKRCLQRSAAAVLFCHNHPSGNADESRADVDITRRLSQCLAFIDVRVIDHIIVGSTTTVSLAERGLL
jgi:DNA repair protein RadC